MSGEAQPHSSSAAPCECCSTYSGHIFTSSKLGSIFFCVFVDAGFLPTVYQVPRVSGHCGRDSCRAAASCDLSSDHLRPALTRSRPVVLITACFSAPRPICLTLIGLISQCKKLWAATALRIPAQICARLQLEGPIRRPQGLSTQQILSNLLTYIQKWLR